ncbi:urease accessory protein UreD [Blochmannia endosymbiont of Colobopsis nipponica]|uniref:urease accessory protein UreD n=1 Tax=Blochmannia endosymbiont of Colobopsis nipponica TaxID=2681987 RepID=UPI00177D8520|nr:urease accessory protein UreD [Blochmannia endosymbiont of Colobopsis nipponica]QOI10946.1 urease accessory protein UreD [Blochmannia endosymbiont of Colobopsis nipponica]
MRDFSEWLGTLELGFGFSNGRTVLVKYKHCGPFLIQRPFYPEGDSLPHVYLLHPPGGLVGGDRLVLDVNLFSSTRVLLTMPSANKFYRSAKSHVVINQRFIIGSNSTLEWLPSCSIFFPKSKVIINTIFFLAYSSRLIGFDSLCFGFPALQEVFEGCTLINNLCINLPNHVGLRDKLKINQYSLKKLGGHQISSTFFAIPVNQFMLDEVRSYLQSSNISFFGATLLDDLLVVRLLDNDNRVVNRILRCMWGIIRPSIIGCKAVPPRIWLT